MHVELFVDTLHVRFHGVARYDEVFLDKAHVASARHAEEYLCLAFRQPVRGSDLRAFFFEGVFVGAVLRGDFGAFDAVDGLFEAELSKPEPKKRYEHEQCAGGYEVRLLSAEGNEIVCRMSCYRSHDGS